eukprot:gene3395-biopygen64
MDSCHEECSQLESKLLFSLNADRQLRFRCHQQGAPYSHHRSRGGASGAQTTQTATQKVSDTSTKRDIWHRSMTRVTPGGAKDAAILIARGLTSKMDIFIIQSRPEIAVPPITSRLLTLDSGCERPPRDIFITNWTLVELIKFIRKMDAVTVESGSPCSHTRVCCALHLNGMLCLSRDYSFWTEAEFIARIHVGDDVWTWRSPGWVSWGRIRARKSSGEAKGGRRRFGGVPQPPPPVHGTHGLTSQFTRIKVAYIEVAEVKSLPFF